MTFDQKAKVRKRASYVFFRNALYAQKLPPERFLQWLKGALDDRHAFGSMRNSRCAGESLALLIEDEKAVKAPTRAVEDGRCRGCHHAPCVCVAVEA